MLQCRPKKKWEIQCNILILEEVYCANGRGKKKYKDNQVYGTYHIIYNQFTQCNINQLYRLSRT